MVAPISLSAFHAYFDQLDHVQYKLGAKADSLSEDPAKIKVIDCSGFARYIAYNASGGKIVMPDGSAIQHNWCEMNLKKIKDYKGVGRPDVVADTSRLFIAFLPVSGGHGHVYYVIGGKTYESHGGKGVDSRSWDTPILLYGVCACYEFETVA